MIFRETSVPEEIAVFRRETTVTEEDRAAEFVEDPDFEKRRRHFLEAEERWEREHHLSLAEYRQGISLEDARRRLERLAASGLFRDKISMQEIDQFPEDLERPSDGQLVFVDPLRVGGRDGRKVCRVSVGRTTVLVGLRPDQFFAGDTYRDGKLSDGGNNDLLIGELIDALRRQR